MNVEKCKTHKIDWCEVCLKLTDMATNNVGDNDLNTIMKYIMVFLTTEREHLYNRGDRIQDTGCLTIKFK